MSLAPDDGVARPGNPVVRYFRQLGPGLVTGASDDDPSGITTYAVAGAALGYAPLWTALATLPLMSAVQLTCARIALVTGRGLAGVVRRHYPRPLLHAACLLLLAANVFNIAADLSGMADAAEMVTGMTSRLFVPLFGVGLIAAVVWTSYAVLARGLKWLTAALFAYVGAAVLSRPDWWQALHATMVPRMSLDRDGLTTLVAILGTTISPYLFFWQASQEVEEERARGRTSVRARRGMTPGEWREARADVATGMVFSNAVMYAIILATAATLHQVGHRDIESSRQAAEALRPIAGDAAYWLFAIGLVGTGLLAIPVLAGSASYAIAEMFGWRAGLDLAPRRARRFYLVLGGAIAAGTLLDLLDINPIRLMVASAVFNGLLAPPLLVLIMLVASNRTIMGRHVNGVWLNVLGWLAAALMTAAAVAFLVTLGG